MFFFFNLKFWLFCLFYVLCVYNLHMCMCQSYLSNQILSSRGCTLCSLVIFSEHQRQFRALVWAQTFLIWPVKAPFSAWGSRSFEAWFKAYSPPQELDLKRFPLFSGPPQTCFTTLSPCSSIENPCPLANGQWNPKTTLPSLPLPPRLIAGPDEIPLQPWLSQSSVRSRPGWRKIAALTHREG